MTQPPQLFDRALRARRRARAVRAGSFADAAFLHDEAVDGILERLAAVTRPFPDAAVFGAADGRYAEALRGRFGIERLRLFDSAAPYADALDAEPGDLDPSPLEPASCDLIVTGLELHATDDPVGALIQIRRALRPDGLFIGCLFGAETLTELRQTLAQAESEISGGLSPRVSPMIELRAAGALLQRAGFALPVADVDRVTVWQRSALHLMRDLRAMGETNVLRDRPKSFARRALFLRAAEIYAERFARADGKVPATFDLLTLTGWAPAPSQQRPLRPGAAQQRLADALGTEERSAGEKTGE